MEPTARFDGNHWIYKGDKYFVYVVAQGALKCAKVIAGWAGGDASQHRLCLAFRAGWSRDIGHHARLRSGGSATLSVTGNGQWRTVMEPTCASGFRSRWSILLTFQYLMNVADGTFQGVARLPRILPSEVSRPTASVRPRAGPFLLDLGDHRLQANRGRVL